MRIFILVLALITFFPLEGLAQTNDWYRSYPGTSFRSTGNQTFWQRNRPTNTSQIYRQSINRDRNIRSSNRFRSTRQPRRPSYLSPSYRNRSSISQQNDAVVITRVHRQNKALDTDNIQATVMTLTIKNEKNSSGTLPRAYEFGSVDVQLMSASGVFTDFSDWALVVGESETRLNPNGKQTIRFSRARITDGDSLEIPLQLKLVNTENLPRFRGSLQLKVSNPVVYQENSSTQVQTSFRGPTTSNYITWNPLPGVSAGQTSSVTGTVQKIYGRTLAAGEKESVLSLNLQANFDDLEISDITVRDTLSGGNIDTWIRLLELVDASGKVLDSTRFLNGVAQFDNLQDLVVYRNRSLPVYFRATVRSPLPSGAAGAFKLDIGVNDLVVRSLSNGNILGASAKTVNVSTETFQIASAAGGVRVSPSQPQIAATGASHNSIYRFTVGNPSRNYLSLGRMTFEVQPTGMIFHNGISSDDFLLSEYHNGQDYILDVFSPTALGSNRVRFDANRDFTISPGSSRTFTVQARLQDQDGDNSIAIRMLSDNSFNQSTLAVLQNSSLNFIWSDNSARPHSVNSGDWLSGYLFRGLPTNTIVNR